MRVDRAKAAATDVEFMDFAFPSPVPLVVHLRMYWMIMLMRSTSSTTLNSMDSLYSQPSDDIHLAGRLKSMNGNDICKRIYEAGGIAVSTNRIQRKYNAEGDSR